MMKQAIVGIGVFVGVLALTGPALADTTVSASVGPAVIPGVPVEVCVVQTDVPDAPSECITTPEAVTVALDVVVSFATPEVDVTPPTIMPATCPAGTDGVALSVATGGVDVAIGGSVTVTLVVDGTVVTQAIPIDQVVVGPDQTVTVFACAGVQPGLTLPTLL